MLREHHHSDRSHQTTDLESEVSLESDTQAQAPPLARAQTPPGAEYSALASAMPASVSLPAMPVSASLPSAVPGYLPPQRTTQSGVQSDSRPTDSQQMAGIFTGMRMGVTINGGGPPWVVPLFTSPRLPPTSVHLQQRQEHVYASVSSEFSAERPNYSRSYAVPIATHSAGTLCTRRYSTRRYSRYWSWIIAERKSVGDRRTRAINCRKAQARSRCCRSNRIRHCKIAMQQKELAEAQEKEAKELREKKARETAAQKAEDERIAAEFMQQPCEIGRRCRAPRQSREHLQVTQQEAPRAIVAGEQQGPLPPANLP